MPDTFTSRLKVRQPEDGAYEDSGAAVFADIMQRLDDSIAGAAFISMSDANYTLSTTNGDENEARKAMLVCSGALTANRYVIVPSVSKEYVVENGTSGGKSIIVSTTTSGGITIPNGKIGHVWCDGSTVKAANTWLPDGVGGGGSGGGSGGGGGGGGDDIDTSSFATISGSQTLSNKTLASPTLTGQTKNALGSGSAPSYTFNGDLNTGLYSPGADSVALATGGSGRLFVGSTGRVGIGLSSPSSALHLRQGSGAQTILLQDTSTTNTGWLQGGNSSGPFVSCGVGSPTAQVGVWKATPTANLHIGVFNKTGSYHIIQNGNADSQGDRILSIDVNATLSTAQFFHCINNGWSTTGAAMRVGANQATSRSINAAGSVNTAGNDYAEWHRKAPGCGEVKAGDLVGIDENDEITTTFADAIVFAIVSTEPAFVGGDVLEDESLGARLAYCGRVPVNDLDGAGCKAGWYVFPIEREDGGIGVAADLFGDLNNVGRIAKVDKDGVVTVRVALGA